MHIVTKTALEWLDASSVKTLTKLEALCRFYAEANGLADYAPVFIDEAKAHLAPKTWLNIEGIHS